MHTVRDVVQASEAPVHSDRGCGPDDAVVQQNIANAPVWPHSRPSLFPEEISLEAYGGEEEDVDRSDAWRSGLRTSARSLEDFLGSRVSTHGLLEFASDLVNSVICK